MAELKVFHLGGKIFVRINLVVTRGKNVFFLLGVVADYHGVLCSKKLNAIVDQQSPFSNTNLRRLVDTLCDDCL